MLNLLSSAVYYRRTMIDKLTEKFYNEYKNNIYVSVDRLFAFLMVVQWIFGIFLAFVISPKTWIGTESYTSMNIQAALFLGTLINLVPAILGFFYPGRILTRYVIAIGQSLTSTLLIHLTGGRIETHFHVFGSLAFLAAYRDISVLLIATSIITSDHLIRGIFFPQSVFGVIVASKWRWLEHAAWVIFEDIFLFFTISKSEKEMLSISSKQAQLSQTKEIIEEEIKRRTQELEEFNYVLAHELRSSLGGISTLAQLFSQNYEKHFDKEDKINQKLLASKLKEMKNFIDSLLSYSRISINELSYSICNSDELIQEVVNAIPSNSKVSFILAQNYPVIWYNPDHFRLIINNLINNSITHNQNKGIQIKIWCEEKPDSYIFYTSDTGIGINKEHHQRIFKIFQKLENRDHSDRVGVGLSFAKKIVEIHGGNIGLESNPGEGAKFFFSVLKTKRDNI